MCIVNIQNVHNKHSMASATYCTVQCKLIQSCGDQDWIGSAGALNSALFTLVAKLTNGDCCFSGVLVEDDVVAFDALFERVRSLLFLFAFGRSRPLLS